MKFIPYVSFDVCQPAEEFLAERRVERRPFRLHHNQPAVSVLADIPFLRRIERDEALLATHPVAHHHQQTKRILLNESFDLR